MSLRRRGMEKKEHGGPWGEKPCLTSKDKPANWKWRDSFRLCFFFFFFTRISFPFSDPHLLKHQGRGPQWATYCEHGAELLAEVTQAACERQTGRRSTVSSKIWDQVNQSLKSLPFKGPNDHCSSPPPKHTALSEMWSIMKMAFCAVIHFSLTGSCFSKHDIIVVSWLT